MLYTAQSCISYQNHCDGDAALQLIKHRTEKHTGMTEKHIQLEPRNLIGLYFSYPTFL